VFRIVADENVPIAIIQRLRELGNDVAAIRETRPRMPDEEVLASAVESSAVLLTEDKDFGELVFVQQRDFSGVVLLRLHGLTKDQKADVVVATVDTYGDRLVGAFTVVSSRQVRIRPR
jgi:predicted nuclease of predicted toxin-antitoxin system